MSRKYFNNTFLLKKNLSKYFFIYTLINKISFNGKKTKANSLIFNSFALIKKISHKNPIYVYEIALLRIKPDIFFYPLYLKKIKFYIPKKLTFIQSIKIAIHWLLKSIFENSTKQKFSKKLSNEIINAYEGESLSVQKKFEIYKNIKETKQILEEVITS